MKKLVTVLLIACLGLSVCAFSACNKKINVNKTQKLEIYLYNAGYGYEWCESILEAFKEEDWVKEKYPELETSFYKDVVGGTAPELLTSSSKKVNHYEIIMGSGLFTYLTSEYCADLSEGVYNAKVPGEDITFKEKLLPAYVKSAAYVDSSEEQSDIYYEVNYASGMNGLAYNATVLKTLGYDVPNTTDELVSIMKSVYDLGGSSDCYKETYSYVCSSTASYSEYLFNIWWAQYEGSEEYANFYRGIDSTFGERSASVFEQEGRLKSLEVLNAFLGKDASGNTRYTWVNPNTTAQAFREAQNKLYLGTGIFTANGDWLANESRSFYEGLQAKGERCDEVKIMKTPIVSSIIDKLDSIDTDEVLSAVVDAIDNGVVFSELSNYTTDKASKTDLEKVTEEDYDAVYAARCIVYTNGPRHNAVVPKDASGKEVAMDFLRYLATDKANEIYMEKTNGASLPFKYDLREKNADLYSKISTLQQDRISYFSDFDIDVLPDEDSFPLVRYGNLTSFYTCKPIDTLLNGKEGENYGSYSSLAEKIYTDEYLYWENKSGTPNTAWSTCLQLAGVK